MPLVNPSQGFIAVTPRTFAALVEAINTPGATVSYTLTPPVTEINGYEVVEAVVSVEAPAEVKDVFEEDIPEPTIG